MKEIAAKFAPGETGEVRGMATLLCPCCGKTVREPEMEHYYEEKGERSVDICNQCREDIESDLADKLEADVLAPEIFEKLWAEASALSVQQEAQQHGLTDAAAPAVAAALGGEAWNSGGGIMLILFRRADGRLVVLTDEGVCEYASQDAFDKCKADKVIPLR
jgi:hypothetical protein